MNKGILSTGPHSGSSRLENFLSAKAFKNWELENEDHNSRV